MLKAGQNYLLPVLVKLFNAVLTSGKYPQSWARGRIIPLHKKGDKTDPSNYRGLTLSSCLGKLFNSVLNCRLTNFLDANNPICQEQIGFRKKHRTTDHLFIIKNILEKYKKSKKTLYLLFVDFKKAFDQVWHTGLFYKLACTGVSTRFYNLIKDMYSKIKVSVQRNEFLSPEFISSIGVRQGDNLSPTLFNIFINDIPSLFKNECQPAKFGNLSIPCLLYADDLVILSEARDGIQHAANKLNEWSKLWGLKVNVSKTKILTSAPLSEPCIHLNGEPIEQVSSFRYLGLDLCIKGNANHTKLDLSKRASKACFKITKSLKHTIMYKYYSMCLLI